MVDILSTAFLADMWDTDGHMGGGWWVVMMLGMVIFWAAVVVGIVWLARGFAGGRAPPGEPRRETPEEILDRRFAQGDISADEYRERRETIRSGPSTR
jgi:putative membrane protein